MDISTLVSDTYNWIATNRDWLFSGAFFSGLGFLYWVFSRRRTAGIAHIVAKNSGTAVNQARDVTVTQHHTSAKTVKR